MAMAKRKANIDIKTTYTKRQTTLTSFTSIYSNVTALNHNAAAVSVPNISTVLSSLIMSDRYRDIDPISAYSTWRQSLTAGAHTAIEAIEGGATITKQLLLRIGGTPRNLRSAGWYLAVIEDLDGDEQYFRAYVGQSINVGMRIQQHHEMFKQDPSVNPASNSLLYHVWRKGTRKATFMHLGKCNSFIKGDSASEMQLNIGEQLFAEKLQTLQLPTLLRILPDQQLQKHAFGLNVALPIHQAGRVSSVPQDLVANAKIEFSALSKASDPDLREYYDENHHKFTTEQQEKGRQTMAQSQHVQQIYGARQGKQAKTTDLTRGPRTTEEDIMEVICMKCHSIGSKHFDPAPQYEIATDEYVARRAPCQLCPRLPSAPSKSAREIMIPADGSKFVRWDWVGKDKNREDPRWAHKRGGRGK